MTLDVARYGPHGAKPSLLCQGLYVWSIRTKQKLRFDRYFSWNSTINRTWWHDSYRMSHVRSQLCVGTNITRWPFRRRISFLYLSNTRYQLSFTSMYPCKQTNKQTSSDQLTANCGTVGITSNLQQYAAGCILSRTCKLSVIHSHVTDSLLYSPQDFPLFVMIFLTISTTASHGSTNTSARFDSIRIEPNGGRFVQCTPGRDTIATQTPVSPPRLCNCSHRKYGPGRTYKKSTLNRTQQ